MAEPKISIIIPVYNAEKYLVECLESIINQTFKDIEVLCINDGSKDSSLDILNAFKEKDNRIEVFSQENAGPAKARNVGLDAAKGEYLMFCDSDDTYEPEMCERMYGAITENDVDFAMCDANHIIADENHGRGQGALEYHNLKYFGYIPLTPWMRTKINVLLWNKIFKRALIQKYHISFPNGYESDDNAFIWQYLSISDSFYGIKEKLYNYRLLNNSIMGKIYAQKNTDKLYDRIYAIKHTLTFLKANNLISQYPFMMKEVEKSVGFVRQFLSLKGQIKFFKLLNQEALNTQEIREFLMEKEEEYPLTRACATGEYWRGLLRKKHHFFKKIFGSVRDGDRKRFYFLGMPIFKRKQVKTEEEILKEFYILGIRIYKKRKKVGATQIPEIPNLKTPISVPENERYILCFDCVYDKGQEAIDAWTFFKYLQGQKIPSKYVLLKGNDLEKEVREMRDVIIINKQDDFYEQCSEIIRRSKCVITSFGLLGKIDRCLRELDYLNYIYIGHGATLLKKGVLELYNPTRFHKILASNKLTYGLYKEKGWNDSEVICAGMPRWDLLAQKESNGHIFVFFTWRKTFYKTDAFQSKYIMQIGKFLKNLRQAVPDTPIDIALHHEAQCGDIKRLGLEALNIRILPTSEVSKAIRTSSMLITDYSSVFWDFIYMDKPVVLYRFDKDDLSLNQVDQEALVSAMQEDKKLYNCLYEEKDVLEKVSYYVRNKFQIEPEIAVKNKTIFWENRNNCETLLKLINNEK